MLTREALKESLDRAKDDIARAPVDGMLAHLILVVEMESNTWTTERVAIVALAYADAVRKNGGRG